MTYGGGSLALAPREEDWHVMVVKRVERTKDKF